MCQSLMIQSDLDPRHRWAASVQDLLCSVNICREELTLFTVTLSPSDMLKGHTAPSWQTLLLFRNSRLTVQTSMNIDWYSWIKLNFWSCKVSQEVSTRHRLSHLELFIGWHSRTVCLSWCQFLIFSFRKRSNITTKFKVFLINWPLI